MLSFCWNIFISFDSILISLWITWLAGFYGWLILNSFFNKTKFDLESLAFSLGLGFGLLSFFVLSLGICNLLYPRLVAGLLILLSLPAFYLFIYRIIKKHGFVFHPTSFVLKPEYLWLLLVLFLFFTQLNITLLPPYEYDALEYHFGIPDYYLQHHKITSVPGNVYAHFPANVEMLYTLGMLLRDDVTGKLFHFYFGLLTALGLFALGKKLYSAHTGGIAATIFLALPLVFQLHYQANIDLALSAYSVLALFAFVNFIKEKKLADLMLVSVFAGLGLGCKYTAMLTIVIPLFLLLLWHIFIDQKSKPKFFIFRTWYFVLCTLLLVSPWLLKNLIFTGNPVFPLFYNLFGGFGWTSELAKKFMQAHLSFNYLKPFYQDFSRITILTLLLLLIALKKDKFIRYIFIYIFSGYLLWFFLTEHIERFLMPILPFVAFGLAFIIYQYLRHPLIKFGLSAIAAGVIFIICFRLSPTLPPAGLTKPEWRRQILTGLSIYPAVEYINTSLPENATVLFVAEARRHLVARPAIINTVFDQNPIFELANSAKSPEEIYLGLREMQVTYIFFNPYELKRLTEFYGPYFNWKSAEQEQQYNDFFEQYTQIEWAWYDLKIYRLKT